MRGDGERWREARRSWDRLRSGGDPLEALADIGRVRRLLDEAELDAVRSARRRGSSWAEIAIKLGVSRQSAWERWSELDDPRAPGPVPDRAAGQAGRGATVAVPSVVGMPYDEADVLLARNRLVAVPADPASGRHLMSDAVVTDQSPESGAAVRPGDPVTLWTEADGGSGVREPRRPKPTPREMREPVEEATG